MAISNLNIICLWPFLTLMKKLSKIEVCVCKIILFQSSLSLSEWRSQWDQKGAKMSQKNDPKTMQKGSQKRPKNTPKCPGRRARTRLPKLACSRGSLLAKCPRARKSRKSVPKELHESAPIGAKKSPKNRKKIPKSSKTASNKSCKDCGKSDVFLLYFALFSIPFRRHFRRFFGVFWTCGAARLAQRPSICP